MYIRSVSRGRSGRLAPGTLQLLEDILAINDDLRRAAHKSQSIWDGTLVIKNAYGKKWLAGEQVVAVADIQGKASGFQ
jgi:hypothetical protein